MNRELARETDAALSEIHSRLWSEWQHLADLEKRLISKWYANRTDEIKSQIEKREATIHELSLKRDELDSIWINNGRWSRAFVVPGGHVHRTMACHTCFVTTRFWWNVDFSGATEEEIVEAAGDRACTVCYPSAPVDKPSTMFTPDERKTEADRVAREQAKADRAAKAAAKAPTVDGQPLLLPSDNGHYMETIKTEVAARQEWNRAQYWRVCYGDNAAQSAYYDDRQDRIEIALAGKYGITQEEMQEQLRTKYAKRPRR